MAANFDDVIKDALSLAPGARAMLADHLLQSLDAENQKRVDAIWGGKKPRNGCRKSVRVRCNRSRVSSS